MAIIHDIKCHTTWLFHYLTLVQNVVLLKVMSCSTSNFKHSSILEIQNVMLVYFKEIVNYALKNQAAVRGTSLMKKTVKIFY